MRTQIREWFGNGRKCNLGIVTGGDLLIIDPDLYKDGAVDAFQRLEAELGTLPHQDGNDGAWRPTPLFPRPADGRASQH